MSYLLKINIGELSLFFSLYTFQGFIRIFVGRRKRFQNSEIDIKHTFLGRSGGMLPQIFLTNHCPEIESGTFWQLADCSQVLITCVQNHCHFLLF